MLRQGVLAKNSAASTTAFTRASDLAKSLDQRTIALLAVHLIGFTILYPLAGSVFAQQAPASPSPDHKETDGISLVSGAPETSFTVSTNLTVALPLTNAGARKATDVSVTSVALSGGAPAPWMSFPVRLGSIAPNGAPATFYASFFGTFVPGGKYLLTVKGTYLFKDHDKDRDRGFHFPWESLLKDKNRDRDEDRDTAPFVINQYVIAPDNKPEPQKLRVSPDNITLLLDESVTLTAALENLVTGDSLPPGSIVWEAQNITENRPARISRQGTFSAKLPGVYKITAKAGSHTGSTTIRVPDGVTRDPNEKPSQVTPVSSLTDLGASPPPLPQPPITSAGWQDYNFRSAFRIENRRGHNPMRLMQKRVSPPTSRRPAFLGRSQSALNADIETGETGNSNYLLTVPILDLPGRGLDLALSLFYNSKLWTKIQTDDGQYTMIFDKYHDWPAPGWSLGFGKAVQMGSQGLAMIDADSTIHIFNGSVNTYASGYTDFVSYTNDGSLCDCVFKVFVSKTKDVSFISGSVKYPNGKVVDYGARGDYTLYPTQITDANGNFITITYHNNRGPQLETVQDTLGRVIRFEYDSNGLLTAVTAPGLGGSERTIVRLHYQSLELNFHFTLPSNPASPTSPTSGGPLRIEVIDAIYDPGTSTGYWFGDSDSYSTYGMIAKVSKRRGMTFQSQ